MKEALIKMLLTIDAGDIISSVIAALALCFTAYTFIKNQRFIKKQQFEATFFNMMKQLEDIVSKLTYNESIVSGWRRDKAIDKTGKEVLSPAIDSLITTGTDVFKYLYENTKIIYIDKSKLKKGLNPEDEGIFQVIDHIVNSAEEYYSQPIGYKNVIKDLGIRGYESIKNFYVFDQYNQYVYQIMKFVNEATFLENDNNYIDERYKYTSILRATLSPYELVFLFYNSLTNGQEKVKTLIEKYSLLKNLRGSMLAKSLRDNNLVSYGDLEKYGNDYDRFNTEIKKDKLKYYWSAFKKDLSFFS